MNLGDHLHSRGPLELRSESCTRPDSSAFMVEIMPDGDGMVAAPSPESALFRRALWVSDLLGMR
jgi:hypothetical protein